MSGISKYPHRRDPQRALSLHPPPKNHIYEPRSGTSPDTESAGALIWDSTASRRDSSRYQPRSLWRSVSTA